ncbi:MAG: hypothetical protein ABEJ56_05100 [Candidatus Nanohaloarchaea archaeon]
MDQAWFKIIFLASLSGLIGYLSYMESGLVSGVIVTVFSGVILGSLMSGIGLWKSLGALKNPFMGFLISFMLSFIYMSFQGDTAFAATMKSIGVAFLGSAVSMFIFNYWNIGG